MEERINEVLRLIDIQLATVPDNPIEESYKARTLSSYVQALNGLLTAQKSYKEENIFTFHNVSINTRAASE